MFKYAAAVLALASISAPAFAYKIACQAPGITVAVQTKGYTSDLNIKSVLNSPLAGYSGIINAAKTTEMFTERLPSEHIIDIALGNGGTLEITFPSGSVVGGGKIQVNKASPKVSLICKALG